MINPIKAKIIAYAIGGVAIVATLGFGYKKVKSWWETKGLGQVEDAKEWVEETTKKTVETAKRFTGVDEAVQNVKDGQYGKAYLNVITYGHADQAIDATDKAATKVVEIANSSKTADFLLNDELISSVKDKNYGDAALNLVTYGNADTVKKIVSDPKKAISSGLNAARTTINKIVPKINLPKLRLRRKK